MRLDVGKTTPVPGWSNVAEDLICRRTAPDFRFSPLLAQEAPSRPITSL